MSDYWSLVIFTLLAQASCGIMLILPFRSGENTGKCWLSAILLCVGALASLGHLSAPQLSYFTIVNIGSSWLSREIAMCGVFGASILAYIFLQKRWLLWLSAICGLVFICAMSRLYMIPTEPAWNTPLTFLYFLAAAVILGASLILWLDEWRCGDQPGLALRGGMPLLIMAVMCLSLIFLFLQAQRGEALNCGALWYAILLAAGAGIGLFCLSRRAAPQPDREPAGKGLLLAGTTGVCALVWIAEICGRVGFYKSYVWFGM